MRILKALTALACILLLTQCAVSVPKSDIPASAWRPDDIGVATNKIYIQKSRSGSDLRLRADDKYDVIGVIQPGEKIQITRCYRYPVTTAGGTHLDAVILDGKFSGTKVSMGILGNTYDFIYLKPNPKVLERINH